MPMTLPDTADGNSRHQASGEAELLLVGSVGLGSAEEVFRTVGRILGGRLKRIPDGETGERSLWVYWPRRVITTNDAFEIDPDEGNAGTRATSKVEGLRQWVGGEAAAKGAPPPPRMRIRAGIDQSKVRLGELGYATTAIESYAVFCRLRDEGVLDRDVRFQVSLPTAAAFLNAHIVYSQHEVMEAIYTRALLDEVRFMADTIDPRDLAIQWDVSTELAQIEGVRHAYFGNVEDGVVERLLRHCYAVPVGVELGIHFCYGNYGHRHWMEPKSTAVVVSLHNKLANRLDRPIDWIHLPVPRDRDDAGYFEPLSGLQLRPECTLFLGLLHLTDGVSGAARRIAAAKAFVSNFGLATECGFGRRPPDSIPKLLEFHAAVQG